MSKGDCIRFPFRSRLRGRRRASKNPPPLRRWVCDFGSWVLAYDRLHAFAGHWLVKLALAGTVFLSLWSTAHRLRITCYDLGIRADTAVATLVYAAALAGTGAAVLYLARI